MYVSRIVKAAAADTIILSTTSRIPEITPSPSSFPTQGYTIGQYYTSYTVALDN